MKHLLLCIVALLLIVPFLAFGQEQIQQMQSSQIQQVGTTPVVFGEPIPKLVKTYKLSAAYPIAKSLIGQNIILVGTVEKYCASGCWITLIDYKTRVPVISKIVLSSTTQLQQSTQTQQPTQLQQSTQTATSISKTPTLPTNLAGKTVSLYGGFVATSAQTSTQLQTAQTYPFQFVATSLRVP